MPQSVSRDYNASLLPEKKPHPVAQGNRFKIEKG
jgi:hypothetical protein